MILMRVLLISSTTHKNTCLFHADPCCRKCVFYDNEIFYISHGDRSMAIGPLLIDNAATSNKPPLSLFYLTFNFLWMFFIKMGSGISHHECQTVNRKSLINYNYPQCPCKYTAFIILEKEHSKQLGVSQSGTKVLKPMTVSSTNWH